MRKFKIILATSAIITALVLQNKINVINSDDGKLCQTFTTAGCIAKEGRLDITGKFNGYLSENDIAALKQYISNDLEERFCIEVGIHKVKQENSYRIIVSLTGDNTDFDIADARKQILKRLEECNIDIMSNNIILTGNYQGKLSEKSKDRIAKDMLKRLEAKPVSESERSIATVFTQVEAPRIFYAYSGLIKDVVSIGKCKININIVFSYDELKDVTVMYLASPVMNLEY